MLFKSTLVAVAGLAAMASATTCEEQRGICETTATANRSYCAAQYDQCLQAEGSSYPGEAPASTTCTDSAASVVYTVTTTPDAASTTCTETPAPTVPASLPVYSTVPTDCVVATCEAKRSACQSTTTVNESYCASIYIQCLSAAGISYNPNTPPVETCTSAPATYTAPPVASTTGAAGSCEVQRGICETTTTANESYCAALYYECLGSASSSMPVTLAPGATTPAPAGPYPTASPASDCEAQRGICESTATANRSYCASLYFACIARSSSTLAQGTGVASGYTPANSYAANSYSIAVASTTVPPHIATGAATKPLVGGAVAFGALAVALL